MRGKDTRQSAMFSYLSAERRVPADHPLRPIRAMVDVALKGLSRSFARMYPDWGRPSIAPEKLLRALLLPLLYSIRSDGCWPVRWPRSSSPRCSIREAGASQKSFQRKDDDEAPPPDEPGNRP